MNKIAAFIILLSFLIQTGCAPNTDKTGIVKNSVPAWMDGYPLYEVYVRDITPEGTFSALEQRLPELNSFGINNLWLMPIHPIGEKGRKGTAGCPYSVRDYFEVGEEYGTMEDFDNLVKAAHNLGMKVILDMVINHCANDHVEMQNHPEWYAQDSTGNFTREVADWWDVTDWNFENPETVTYLDSMLTFWVKEHDVDGFRCDVAGMVPDEFWAKVIPNLKKIKPYLYMLAEWESPNMYNAGFHSTYDWHLYHTVKSHKEGKTIVADLWKAVSRIDSLFPPQAMPLRFVENHDQLRSRSVFGEEYYLYAGMVFTLPGIPLLYNGQEAGETHKPSLFEKEPINWKAADGELYEFYRRMTFLRNNEEILRKGSLEKVSVGGEDILAYLRILDKKHIIIIINFGASEDYLMLPAEVFNRVHEWEELFSKPPLAIEKMGTQQTITMPPKSILIMKQI